jgi:iron complex outermembrane receptor protein
VEANGVQTFYDEKSGVIPITDLDIGYDVLKPLRLSIGSVNLFNRYPDKLPAGLLAAYETAGQSFAANKYVDGPIGIDGGYYYAKATYTF